MRPQSCKAKGRRLQQQVRDALRELGRPYGLVDGDIESRGMGQNGVDVILSPAAQRVFDLLVECKNTEALSVVTTFLTHYNKYASQPGLKLLIHSRNNVKPLVTMQFTDFLNLLETTCKSKSNIATSVV